MIRRILPALCVLTFAGLAFTQSTAPAPARTIIHAGNVLDVRTGKLLPNQTIVVENGKIVSIGAGRQVGRLGMPR